jgi:hypothetical protein
MAWGEPCTSIIMWRAAVVHADSATDGDHALYVHCPRSARVATCHRAMHPRLVIFLTWPTSGSPAASSENHCNDTILSLLMHTLSTHSLLNHPLASGHQPTTDTWLA